MPISEALTPTTTDETTGIASSDNEESTIAVQEIDVSEISEAASAFRALITVESKETDPLFQFPLELPDGATIEVGEECDYSAVAEDGSFIMHIGSPWAFDATGEFVSTFYEYEDGVLFQYVDHLARNYEYPIIADPVLLVPLLQIGGSIIVRQVVATTLRIAAQQAVKKLAKEGIKAIYRKEILSIT